MQDKTRIPVGDLLSTVDGCVATFVVYHHRIDNAPNTLLKFLTVVVTKEYPGLE
jgi:hypothetical protein